MKRILKGLAVIATVYLMLLSYAVTYLILSEISIDTDMILLRQDHHARELKEQIVCTEEGTREPLYLFKLQETTDNNSDNYSL